MARPGEGKVVKPFDTKGVDLGGGDKETETDKLINRVTGKLQGFNDQFVLLGKRLEDDAITIAQYDQAVEKLGFSNDDLYRKHGDIIDKNTELKSSHDKLTETLDKEIDLGEQRALAAAEEIEVLRDLERAEKERLARLEQEKKVLNDIAVVGKAAMGGVLQSVGPALGSAGGGAGTILTAGLSGAMSGGALGAAAGAAGAAAFWLAEEIQSKDEREEQKKAHAGASVRQVVEKYEQLRESYGAGRISEEQYEQGMNQLAAQQHSLYETGQWYKGAQQYKEEEGEAVGFFGNKGKAEAMAQQTAGIVGYDLENRNKQLEQQQQNEAAQEQARQDQLAEAERTNELLVEQLRLEKEQYEIEKELLQTQLDAQRRELDLRAAEARDAVSRGAVVTYAGLADRPAAGGQNINLNVAIVDDPTRIDRRIVSEPGQQAVNKVVHMNPDEIGEATS